MKLIYNYWMPTTDNHFERLITKQVSKGGLPEYQNDVRDEAYKHVTDFSLVIDVGANVGLWAKPLTEKFDKVIAFEPLPQVYKCLEKNTVDLPVEIHKYALGNANSHVKMVYNSVNTGGSYILKTGEGDIVIKKLDDLHLPKFGLIKIDCERHELEILKGAQETLKEYKPIIVCEQHPDTEYVAGKFLLSLGAKQITNVRKDYIFGW